MSSSQITALIIDDEKMGRDALKILLRNYVPEVQLLGVSASVREAVPMIEALAPQLVFLDVEMPEEDGFSLFKYFPAPNFQVIFVTAFDKYAIQALRLSALDYLLKPVDLEELEGAVKKALQEIGQPIAAPLLQQALALAKGESLEQIALPNANGFEMLSLAGVIRMEADNNYTEIFLDEGRRLVVSKPLGHFEKLLPPREFFRVHSSHMVKLSRIQRYIKGRGGHLELTDGSVIPVAARKKTEFLRLMGIR